MDSSCSGGTYHGANSVIKDVLRPFWEDWELDVEFERSIDDVSVIVVIAARFDFARDHPTHRTHDRPEELPADERHVSERLAVGRSLSHVRFYP